MTDTNPITHPMTTVLDQSVSAASWLQNNPKYTAAVALARMIAGQIDGIVNASGGSPDAEVLKQLHMRMLPNYHRALYTLGLTPEGYAKMTGVGSVSGQAQANEATGSSTPPGVASPFAAAEAATGDALDEIIAAADNVTKLGDRR